jgi:hypothetical protein
MVNKVLVLENRRGILECKHKQKRQSQHSTNSRPRFGSSFAGPIFYPMQQNVQPMPQPTRQGFATLVSRLFLALTAMKLQTLESKCAKDSSQSKCHPNPTGQEILQLWAEGSVCYYIPQSAFTSSFDINI